MSTDTIFLGIIALATFVMALLQVAGIIVAIRQLGPILANARKVSEDAARVSSLALKQVERVDRFVDTTTTRVDDTLKAVQEAVTSSARQGATMFAGLQAAMAVFAARRAKGKGGAAADDDENLFIG